MIPNVVKQDGERPETQLLELGLDFLLENLQACSAGEEFLPLYFVGCGGGLLSWRLIRVFRCYASCRGFDFVLLTGSKQGFPSPHPTEAFGDLVRRLRGNKKSCGNGISTTARPGSPLDSDQAVFLYPRERFLVYERCLRELTGAAPERPVLFIVELTGPIDPELLELLRYISRSSFHRQRAAQNDLPWPQACFVVLLPASEEKLPASLKGDPFAASVRVDSAGGPKVPAEESDGSASRLFGALPERLQRTFEPVLLAPYPLALSVWRKCVDLPSATFYRCANELQERGFVWSFGKKSYRRAVLLSESLREELSAFLTEERKRELHLRLAQIQEANPIPAACYHFAACGETKRAYRLGIQAANFLRRRGGRKQAEELLSFLLERLGGEIPARFVPVLRRSLAELLTLRGAHAEARELLVKNAANYLEKNDRYSWAATRVDIGVLETNLGRRGAAFKALEEAEKALKSARRRDAVFVRLLLIRARLYLEEGRFEEARRTGEEALRLLHRHAQEDRRWNHIAAFTFSRLGSIYSALSDFQKALKYYELSQRKFHSFPDCLEKGALWCNSANLYTNCGRYALAFRCYKRAAGIARAIGAKELLALVEANMGVLRLYRWELGEAERHIEAARCLAEEAGSERFLKFARLCRATLRCRQGRYAEALRLFLRQSDEARRSGDRYALMNISFQSVYPLMALGRFREALREARRGLRIARKLAWPRGILEGNLALAQAACRLRSWQSARKYLKEAKDAPWSHHGQVDAEIAYLEGKILVAAGDLQAALAAYRRSKKTFGRLRIPVWALPVSVDFADALHLRGRKKAARVELEKLWRVVSAQPNAERHPEVWLSAAIVRCRRLLEDRPQDAKLWRNMSYELSEAVSKARSSGMRPLLWQLLCLRGACLDFLGERERAEQDITEALSEYRRFAEQFSREAKRRLAAEPVSSLLHSLASEYRPSEPAKRPPKKRTRAVKRKSVTLRSEEGAAETPAVWHGMVAVSACMREIFDLIERIAPTEIPVLITGESGTGKELAARAIHRLSRRSRGPFVAENCAAIPQSLAESEFFGFSAGAFTGADRRHMGRIEAASGGTLFLDEIGELPLPLQAKFLRVLAEGTVRPLGSAETRTVNVRLVCATARDLRSDVERGTFRADLFYRILGTEIRLPPLRERREDILPLVEHFFKKYTPAGRRPPRLTTRAKRRLLSYLWPGNVRELENEIRRLALLGEGIVQERDVLVNRELRSYELLAPGAVRRYALSEAQEILEREYLLQALEETGGNVSRTAKLAGVNRRTIYKMLKRLRIEPKDLRRT